MIQSHIHQHVSGATYDPISHHQHGGNNAEFVRDKVYKVSQEETNNTTFDLMLNLQESADDLEFVVSLHSGWTLIPNLNSL